MKKILLKYWWILPILLCVCMLGLLFSLRPSFIETIVGILFFLNIILLFISWIVLLVNKKWWQCLLSFGLSAVIISAFGFPMVISSMSVPDGFGCKHQIPEGLSYQIPMDAHYDWDVLIDSLDTETYLQVWEGMQGGIYKYDFYYPSLPAGEVFLRCYEVTDNIPLSEGRLQDRSAVQVNETASFSQIVRQKQFTIYEGEWGDYYAARIEVWFRYAASKQERKLCEKIYRVEGWMR